MRALLFLLMATSIAAAPAATRRHAVVPQAPCFSTVLAQAATATIAIDNDSVYYGDDSGPLAVYRVAKTGGVPRLLASFPCCVATQMVVDADNVYVAMQPFGDALHTSNDRWIYTIYAISKSTGVAVLLADGVWLPQQLAVDDRFVYWASLGTVIKSPEFASDGKIERVNKDGTGRLTLASGLSGPTSVAADDTFVYFAESGLAHGNSSSGARRVPKEGGSVQRLYDRSVDSLVLNGDDLYLISGNTSTGKTTISQTAKNGSQVKRTFNDSLIINPVMTIFDGRVYYLTQTKAAFAVASVTLDLTGRTVHVERHFNSGTIGVDGCALYISTIAANDFEVERVVR
jgi:hypothetical protein